ncbi:MAG: hypothetical protein Homavirus8_9 [Homavirus sp.]|uniref:Leucine-rich repeat protein n=1 Tax=Homavirus sp. TaxID=2487769 RepID=A0A3G5A4E6_9VIRU|nr:MAG: hypothetical protein Homavirus8_9 [Homavirus sp.]
MTSRKEQSRIILLSYNKPLTKTNNNSYELIDTEYTFESLDDAIEIFKILRKNTAVKEVIYNCNVICKYATLDDQYDDEYDDEYCKCKQGTCDNDKCFKYFLKTIKGNKSINKVNIYTSLNPTNLNELQNKFLVNKHITDLGIGCCGINNKVVSIVNILSKNTTLVHLRLFSNKIGNIGIQFICNALSYNDTLYSLDISYNTFNDDSTKSIVNMITRNKRLHTLHLEGNKINAENIYKIIDSIQKNKSICQLYIGHSELNGDFEDTILNAIKCGKLPCSLDVLYIRTNKPEPPQNLMSIIHNMPDD